MENREEFISSNLGLVYACAKRFRGRGIEYEDLVQAGSLGLVKAADAFDEGRGVRFSTYAGASGFPPMRYRSFSEK